MFILVVFEIMLILYSKICLRDYHETYNMLFYFEERAFREHIKKLSDLYNSFTLVSLINKRF